MHPSSRTESAISFVSRFLCITRAPQQANVATALPSADRVEIADSARNRERDYRGAPPLKRATRKQVSWAPEVRCDEGRKPHAGNRRPIASERSALPPRRSVARRAFDPSPVSDAAGRASRKGDDPALQSLERPLERRRAFTPGASGSRAPSADIIIPDGQTVVDACVKAVYHGDDRDLVAIKQSFERARAIANGPAIDAARIAKARADRDARVVRELAIPDGQTVLDACVKAVCHGDDRDLVAIKRSFARTARACGGFPASDPTAKAERSTSYPGAMPPPTNIRTCD